MTARVVVLSDYRQCHDAWKAEHIRRARFLATLSGAAWSIYESGNADAGSFWEPLFRLCLTYEEQTGAAITSKRNNELLDWAYRMAVDLETLAELHRLSRFELSRVILDALDHLTRQPLSPMERLSGYSPKEGIEP